MIIFADINKALSMNDSYNEGLEFGNKPLVIDKELATGSLMYKSADDAKSLWSNNDTTLSEKGSNALGSEQGSILIDADKQIINGLSQYQIREDDPDLKASFLLEQDPLSSLGGKAQLYKSSSKQIIEKSCLEGVEFEIDIINQLVFNPPLRRMQNTELTIHYRDHLSKVSRKYSAMSRMNKYLTNQQVDMAKFRQYDCPHFVPRDVITGRMYKIDCKRIQNFCVVRVIDKEHKPYRDLYQPNTTAVGRMVVRYRHDTYQSEDGATEGWRVVNQEDEQLIEENDCWEVSRTCLDSGDKYFDELKVSRKCWKEKISYKCKSLPQGTCDYLREAGCSASGSSICQKYSKNNKICLLWEHHYKCESISEVTSKGIGKDGIFCLEGNCYSPKHEKNTDMALSIAALGSLADMASEGNFIKADPPEVFPGKSHGCNKFLAGFRNCCQIKGWGLSIGIAGCSEDDKHLAHLRNQGLCHYIGTYCAEKIPIIGCIRKKSIYCCFKSKMARIFHEQGRKQIDKDWGDTTNTDCSAFSVEELTNMDFSLMDLSEIFDEIYKKAGKGASKNMEDMIKGYSSGQMPVMQGKIDQMREKAYRDNKYGEDYDQSKTNNFGF